MNTVLVLQIEDRNNSNLNTFMEENKKLCLANDIKYVFLKQTSFNVPPYWAKVFELNKLMKENPNITYFMWLDSDAFFINFSSEKFHSFLKKHEAYSVIISKDMPPWGGIFNAGSFIVKNDVHGKEIMKEWISNYNPDKWKFISSKWYTQSAWAGEDYEQGSFTKNIFNNPKYYKHIVQLPYYYLNNNSCEKFSDETITAHLAAEFKTMPNVVQKCLNIFKNVVPSQFHL
jgi:hypothetical protein